MSVFSFSAEIEALIDDLGLIPLSSPEAQSALLAFRARYLDVCTDFEAELRNMPSFEDPASLVYENLSELYAKYNRKGSRRSFGASLDLQLSLPF